MSAVDSVVDKKKAEALLEFVVTLGLKADLAVVKRLGELAERHIPMLAAIIYTRQMQCIATSVEPMEAYQKAKEVLIRSGSTLWPEECLNEGKAAKGDEFEICKFLLALLYEVRCTCPDVFDTNRYVSSRLNDSCQRRIADMINYLDDPEVWDSTKSWPGALLQPFRSYCETPKTTRGKAVFSTSPLNQSPLSEAVSTPIARANRKIREREKKIKELTDRLGTKEIECDDLERKVTQLSDVNKKLNLRIEGFYSKNGECTMLRLENDHLLQRLQSAEQETKDLKTCLNEKREQLVRNESHISDLNRSLDAAREEVQKFEVQLKDKNDLIMRLRADAEVPEAEIQSLRSENIQLGRKLFNLKQTLEDELREVKSSWELEKDAARRKIMEYEEALAMANAHAHEMSAKLCVSERRNKMDPYRHNAILMAGQILNMKSLVDAFRVDVTTLTAGTMGQLAEVAKNLEAAGEMQTRYSGTCQLYEQSVQNEEKWKHKAMEYESNNEKLKKHCKYLEDMLKEVFETYDTTAAKALDYQSKLETAKSTIASLKEESEALKRTISQLRAFQVGQETNNAPGCCSVKEEQNLANDSGAVAVTSGAPARLRLNAEDENDCVGSKSLKGVDFDTVTPPQPSFRKFGDGSYTLPSQRRCSGSPCSISSGRLSELHNRNLDLLPHLRSVAYPECLITGVDENRFRSSRSFEPTRSVEKKKTSFQKIKNLFQSGALSKK